ncbi:MAG: hypothetical protein GY861_03035 [bacterium]|nr:hypothetical protein [bacterium]
MKLYELNGTYGSGQTPCVVFVYENRMGGKWYAVEDSVNVNYTYDEMVNGIDVELLYDEDFFTAGQPINDLDELERQVDL